MMLMNKHGRVKSPFIIMYQAIHFLIEEISFQFVYTFNVNNSTLCLGYIYCNICHYWKLVFWDKTCWLVNSYKHSHLGTSYTLKWRQ